MRFSETGQNQIFLQKLFYPNRTRTTPFLYREAASVQIAGLFSPIRGTGTTAMPRARIDQQPPRQPAASNAQPPDQHARKEQAGEQGGSQQVGGGQVAGQPDPNCSQGSRQGRDSEVTPTKQSRQWETKRLPYLEARRQGWSAAEACRIIDLNYETMRSWRVRQEGFREEEAEAEAQGDQAMMDMLRGMALNAEDERNRIRAAEVWLRARLPRIERVELSGPNGGPIMGIGAGSDAIKAAAEAWAGKLSFDRKELPSE